jgi:hypothetical protein
VFLLGALALLAFWLVPEQRSLIAFAAALVGGGATVYAAYYSASTLRVHVKRDKQSKSFELLSRLNEEESVRLRVFIKKDIAGKSLSAADLYRLINDNQGHLTTVTAILGFFEDVSIAIQEGYVDEAPIFKSLSYVVPWTYNELRDYIAQTRIIDRDPDIYIEVEKLVDAWKANRLLSGGDVPSVRHN